MDCISAIANVGATVCVWLSECVCLLVLVCVCVLSVSAPLCVIARSARHAHAPPALLARPL